MIYNDNNFVSYNDYDGMTIIPYKIVEILIKDDSKPSNDLWKLLKYSDVDCLSKPNLSTEEKIKLIWKDDSIENDYRIFLKPLIGVSTSTSEEQTQIRIFRNTLYPDNRIQATICYEIDFITNEGSSMVKYNNMIVEKTDLMETLFLKIMNGRDVNVGTLIFDRELTRSCNSQLSISNSKSFYGRSLVMGLLYVNPSTDGCI